MASILDGTDSWEWVGWLGYAAIEPFGPLRDDLRAGTVASAAVAAWGGRATPSDFFESLKQARLASGDSRTEVLAFMALCPAFTTMG